MQMSCLLLTEVTAEDCRIAAIAWHHVCMEFEVCKAEVAVGSSVWFVEDLQLNSSRRFRRE